MMIAASNPKERLPVCEVLSAWIGKGVAAGEVISGDGAGGGKARDTGH